MSLRQIILDTETTGLNPRTGDRIIEIGCIELVNRRLTGRTLHKYVNPERDSDPGALAVHGLTTEFLADKPKFADIVDELRDFVDGSELLIHNASFDLGFLEEEFKRLDLPPFKTHYVSVIDTLLMARELHPGKRNSLDALCERYGVSNAHRTLHGALLDSELLAEVYLAMTRGQESLVIDMDPPRRSTDASDEVAPAVFDLKVLVADADELLAHEGVLDSIARETKGEAVWRRAAGLAAG